MKKSKLLFIITILFFSFNNIYAVEINESKDKSYKYIEKLYFDENKSCSIQIRKYTNGDAGLYIRSGSAFSYSKQDVNSKKFDSSPCGNFPSIKKITLDNDFSKGLNSLENISFSIDGTTLKISGIVEDKNIGKTDNDKKTVVCSGNDYNQKINHGDKTYYCKIQIETDEDDNVILSYYIENLSSKKTVTNPTGRQYTCSGTGVSTTFYISKTLPKGSIKSQADCPVISSYDGDENDTTVNNKDTVIDANRDPSNNHDNSHLNDPGNDIINQGKLNCINLVNTKLNKYIIKIFSIMKYAGIVLCIGLTIYDFAKALLDSDKNALNKITKRALTRLILVALLFFLPTLVNFLISIFVDNPCKINF